MGLEAFLKDGLPDTGRDAWAALLHADIAGPSGRPALLARIDDPDIERARTQARVEVENGADGLALVFEGGPTAFGYGLPATDAALDAVLAPVLADLAGLRLDTHPGNRTTVEKLVAFLARNRADMRRLDLSLGVDPVAVLAGTGRLRMSVEALEASMPQSLAHFFTLGVPAILLEADGRVAHNAGATPAQELGVAIASGVSYLRLFEKARQPLLYAAPHIGFCLAVEADAAGAVAKLEALRRLWARALDLCGVPPIRAKVHAETSWRMNVGRDPDDALSRNTLAALAARFAGADTLSVLPHTLAFGLPDADARRAGRAAGRLALADGSAGFHLETDRLEQSVRALCDEAWIELQRIEAEGGILRSLVAGHLQARINASRALGTFDGVAGIDARISILSAERRPMPSDGAVFCDRLDPIAARPG